MKSTLNLLLVLVLATLSAFGQKGIDTQTQRIKQDANRTTTREGDANRSFDWGKGKTRVRDRLDNPYRFSARRDMLIDSVMQVLKDKHLIVDDAASRLREGIIVTQPYVFAKGPVTTPSELSRYADLAPGGAWSRAQYTLTIEVQPVDGIRHNVSVTAKVEGRSGNGLMSEWTTVQSSGLAEDEFLAKLVEAMTGASPDAPQDTGEKP
ncbi:MAG: hypothetical protein ACK4S4_13695 [Pyrinomonadaceae bacterium]